MSKETMMFDLFPEVGERMLDVEPMDAAARNVVDARRSPTTADQAGPGRLGTVRHSLGVRLIALGSALTIDESVRSRTAAR
jgi:hypothetical protein